MGKAGLKETKPQALFRCAAILRWTARILSAPVLALASGPVHIPMRG